MVPHNLSFMTFLLRFMEVLIVSTQPFSSAACRPLRCRSKKMHTRLMIRGFHRVSVDFWLQGHAGGIGVGFYGKMQAEKAEKALVRLKIFISAARKMRSTRPVWSEGRSQIESNLSEENTFQASLWDELTELKIWKRSRPFISS